MLSLADPRTLLTYGSGILALILGVALGVQTLRLGNAQTNLAQEWQARAEETAQRERVAREATAKIAALQAEHAKRQQEVADAFTQELERRDAAARAASADGDRLRAEINRLASAGPVRPGTDATACADTSRRAAALGDVLGNADKLAERLAGAAERHAAQARALKKQLLADRRACIPPN